MSDLEALLRQVIANQEAQQRRENEYRSSVVALFESVQRDCSTQAEQIEKNTAELHKQALAIARIETRLDAVDNRSANAGAAGGLVSGGGIAAIVSMLFKLFGSDTP